MINKKISVIATGLAAWGLSMSAFATGEGFYMGGLLGLTTVNNQPVSLETGFVPLVNCTTNNGVTTCGTGTAVFGPPLKVSPSNSGYGMRLFGGYNLNNYFAMEFGYAAYGSSTYKIGTPVPPLISGNPQNNPGVRTSAIDFVGKGAFSFWVLNAFLKAGIAVGRQSESGSLVTTYSNAKQQYILASSTNTTVRPTAAIGVGWDITPNWVAELTYSRIFGGSGFQTADMYGVGVSYHFVDIYCGQFLC